MQKQNIQQLLLRQTHIPGGQGATIPAPIPKVTYKLPGMWSNTYLYLYLYLQIHKNWYLYLYLYLSENFKSWIFVFAFVFEPCICCICITYSRIQHTDLMGIADFNSHKQNSSYYCAVILFLFFDNSWQPCIDIFKILLSRESRDTNILVWSCSSLLAKIELLIK